MMKSLRTALRVKRMEQPSEKGYELARWLWVHQPSKNSAKEAFTMLSDIVARPDAPADAFLALANIYRNGGCAVWDDLAPDTEQYIALRDKALDMGSELAETQYAKDRIFGTAAEEDPDAVIDEIEERLRNNPETDPQWLLILAFAYEKAGYDDKVVPTYEEALKQGEEEALFYLAYEAMEHGQMALATSYIDEGMEKGVGGCCYLQGYLADFDFDEQPEEDRPALHEEIEKAYTSGVRYLDDSCAQKLGYYYLHGECGFTPDPVKAIRYLERAILLGDSAAAATLAQAMENESKPIPAELRYSPRQIRALWQTQLWRNPGDTYSMRKLGLLPVGAQNTAQQPKSPIPPAVIYIWPTGHIEIFETDLQDLHSYRRMAEVLFDGEGIEPIHYSPLLEEARRRAEIDLSLAMYLDRDAAAKDLKDNAVATLIYGGEAELRGPAVIAMEDTMHECHSFKTLEDLCATYNALHELVGDLLILPRKDEEDGRYDPFV